MFPYKTETRKFLWICSKLLGSVRCIVSICFCPASWNFHSFFHRFLWKKSHRTLALQSYQRNWTSSHGWPFPAWPYRCCQSHWHEGICSTPRSCDNQAVLQCTMFANVYYIQKNQKTDISLGRVASADNEHARCKYILFPGLRLTSLKTTQNFMSFEEGIAKTSSGFKFSPKMHCKCSDCRVASLNAWLILKKQLRELKKLGECFPMQTHQQHNSSKLLFCWDWHRSDSWTPLPFCPSMLVLQKRQDVGPPAQNHKHASVVHDGIAKKSQEPIRSGCVTVLATYSWIQPYANQDVGHVWDLPSTPLAAMPFPLWCGCWQGDVVPPIFASLAEKNSIQWE